MAEGTKYDRQFCTACLKGDLTRVQELLALTGDKRVNVHYNNDRAFLESCRIGHGPIVKCLLGLTDDREIDIEYHRNSICSTAIKLGHTEIVIHSLQLDDDDRAIDTNRMRFSPLYLACCNGHYDIAQLL